MKLILSFLLFLLSINISHAQATVDSLLYRHAISAPQILNKDINKLLTYLTKSTKSDTQKIQVISYWIANNIEYDLEFIDHYKTYDQTSWQQTISNKKTICQGYSELFKEFCDRLNFECHVIHGFAKGAVHNQGDSLEDTNHAWNIVNIDNKYSLFDLTWASGGSDFFDSTKFIQNLKPEYLFANPITFVEKHLPSKRMWQLLNYPVTLENFESFESSNEMIDSTSYFYNYTDTISSYYDLDEYDREMKDVMDAYEVFPSEYNRAHFSYKKGFELSFGKYDEARFKRSIELLSIALATYQKPEYLYQPYVDSCIDSIKYLEKRLKNKK